MRARFPEQRAAASCQSQQGKVWKKFNTMNTKKRFLLAGAACAVLCATGLAVVPAPAGETPVDSPVAGSAPSQGYVWMSGHWDSQSGQWKWVAAHWELPPSRSAAWVGGHWAPSGTSWVWVNGAWNIAGEPQEQAGPPQPPGQEPSATGVPTPGTPAPMVGQYGPGGVYRDADQPAGPGDYGTVDYSPGYYPAYGYPGYAYPDYGWAGDPYYWGFPGIALGFGFGPGYLGWGRGFSGGFRGRGFAGHGGGFSHAGGGFAHAGSGFAHGGTGHFGH